MEGRRFSDRTQQSADWREKRREAHEAIRNWRGLEQRDASLLWADKYLELLCPGRLLRLPVSPQARGVILRILDELLVSCM